MRSFRRRAKTAEVLRVSLEQTLAEAPPSEHDELLLVPRLHGAVLGHIWLDPSSYRPEDQWAAITREVGYLAAAAALRRRLSEAIGHDDTDAAAAAPPSVSVVVCTRDRPDRLSRCLDRLLALDPPAAEIVVVDNAPSDDATQRLCAELPVRYVREPLPGASRARNRGVAESSAPLIAFTDDDCLPAGDWLAGLQAAFADPMVQVVTGYVGPWELGRPAQRDFERHGGFERHGERRLFEAGRASPAMLAATAGVSANMIVRREAFSAVGGFAEEFGPGTPARSAEDKEFLYRVLAAGHRVVHDPARVVWHQHRGDAAGVRGILRDYGVAEFAWFTDLARRHREPAVARMARWWLGHWKGDVGRWALGRPGAVPLALTAGEVRGALSAPRALRAARRSRRDVPPVDARNPAADGASAGPAVVVGDEPVPLSVAIASRDRRAKLQETLDVLARQEYPRDRWEVVLALDGPTDDSAEMAAAMDFPVPLRIVTQPPRGVGAARNHGARVAEHPIVVFLDDDIHPAQGFLAAHARSHAAAPADQLTLGTYPPATTATDFNATMVRRWWADHFRLLTAPGHRWRFTDICDGNSSIPVRLFQAVGGFDETFTGRRQDYEFGVRILDAGVRVAYVPEAAGLHHFDPTIETTLRNGRQEGRDDARLIRKHPATAATLPIAGLTGYLARLRGGAAWLPRATGLEAWRRSAVRALNALEAANLRSRWTFLLHRVLLINYAGGVVEAMPDPQERAELLDPGRWPRQDLVIDLDHGGGPLEPDAVVLPRVCVQVKGRRVAAVDGVLPGGQWDVEALVERLVWALLAQGALPWVLPDAGEA